MQSSCRASYTMECIRMYPFDTFQSVPFAVIHNSIEVALSSDFCDELPAFANIRQPTSPELKVDRAWKSLFTKLFYLVIWHSPVKRISVVLLWRHAERRIHVTLRITRVPEEVNGMFDTQVQKIRISSTDDTVNEDTVEHVPSGLFCFVLQFLVKLSTRSSTHMINFIMRKRMKTSP